MSDEDPFEILMPEMLAWLASERVRLNPNRAVAIERTATIRAIDNILINSMATSLPSYNEQVGGQLER